MKKIEMLNKGLVGKEMAFVELDNVMVENGYYSVLDDGVTKDIKRDKNVIYTGVESGQCEAIVNFEITIDNGPEDPEEAFYIEIKGVEEF